MELHFNGNVYDLMEGRSPNLDNPYTYDIIIIMKQIDTPPFWEYVTFFYGTDEPEKTAMEVLKCYES